MSFKHHNLRAAGFAAAVAATLGLAACGSSSSSSSTSSASSSSTTTSAAASSAGKTKSSDRTFATTLPSGFTDQTRAAQGGAVNVLLLAVGPRISGETININVIREQARGHRSVDDIAHLEVTGIRSLVREAHGFSSLRALTVGGTPARSVDYLGSPAGHVLHLAQVFILHNNWIYTVTYTALPSTYQGNLASLQQLLGGWVWT